MARRPRRTIGALDARSDAILRAVIDEYVTSATPVSSGGLVAHNALGVSSATVRSILADLESLGLLTHPHTSAGRVPTDAGYRYYVQVLAQEWSLPSVDQRMIRHQFGQVEFASEQWFRLAASTLATNTGTAGLATNAKPVAARVRRVDLVAVQDRLALLVVGVPRGNDKAGPAQPSHTGRSEPTEPRGEPSQRPGRQPHGRSRSRAPCTTCRPATRPRTTSSYWQGQASAWCARCANSMRRPSTTCSPTAC